MNKKQKVFSIFINSLLLLIISIFLTKDYSIVSAATKASSIGLKTTSIFLVKGESTNLKMTGTSKKVSWKSTESSIATVSKSGKVTAVRYGETYIKATVDKKTYKCKVTVINPAEITFKPSDTLVIVDGIGTKLNPVSDVYSAAVLKKAGITYKVLDNANVKVSSTGNVTATKPGAFKIIASVRGKKIATIPMEAVSFNGFLNQEVIVNSYAEEYSFVEFADDFAPVYSTVKVETSNSLIAEVKSDLTAYLDSDIDRCEGIGIRGGIEGTCTVTVTVSGVTKTLKVIVGDGLEKLFPVEAVQKNDFTGYTDIPLTTLTAVREFIDTNNLLSNSLSDREKITIIQNYLRKTYSGNVTDDFYRGTITQVMLKGAGVCASYTETFNFLCEIIGIEVYYCRGRADNGREVGPHAWNKVMIEGKWYYIDAYWNAILDSYDYFLSETLWSNHMLNEEGYLTDIISTVEPPYLNAIY